MQATIVCDGASLIEINVRMALQFVEREAIDIEFARRRVLDDQIALGFERKILDFIELIDAYIAPKALTILDHLTSKIGADAWDGLQLGGIGSIQNDMLSLADLRLVMGHHRVVLCIREPMTSLISRVAIEHLGTDIDRSFAIGLLKRTVAMVLGSGKSIDGIGKNEVVRVIITSSRQEDNAQGDDHHTEHSKDYPAIRLLPIKELADHITPN